MAMLEVAATGMEQLYPGVCSEGLPILMHTFPRRYVRIPAWADTLLVNTQGFSYGLRSGRVEVEAHVLRFVVNLGFFL